MEKAVEGPEVDGVGVVGTASIFWGGAWVPEDTAASPAAVVELVVAVVVLPGPAVFEAVAAALSLATNLAAFAAASCFWIVAASRKRPRRSRMSVLWMLWATRMHSRRKAAWFWACPLIAVYDTEVSICFWESNWGERDTAMGLEIVRMSKEPSLSPRVDMRAGELRAGWGELEELIVDIGLVI